MSHMVIHCRNAGFGRERLVEGVPGDSPSVIYVTERETGSDVSRRLMRRCGPLVQGEAALRTRPVFKQIAVTVSFHLPPMILRSRNGDCCPWRRWWDSVKKPLCDRALQPICLLAEPMPPVMIGLFSSNR